LGPIFLLLVVPALRLEVLKKEKPKASRRSRNPQNLDGTENA